MAEIKHSLFTTDMIIYAENLKESSKKALKLIGSYNNAARDKANI